MILTSFLRRWRSFAKYLRSYYFFFFQKLLLTWEYLDIYLGVPTPSSWPRDFFFFFVYSSVGLVILSEVFCRLQNTIWPWVITCMLNNSSPFILLFCSSHNKGHGLQLGTLHHYSKINNNKKIYKGKKEKRQWPRSNTCVFAKTSWDAYWWKTILILKVYLWLNHWILFTGLCENVNFIILF